MNRLSKEYQHIQMIVTLSVGPVARIVCGTVPISLITLFLRFTAIFYPNISAASKDRSSTSDIVATSMFSTILTQLVPLKISISADRVL